MGTIPSKTEITTPDGNEQFPIASGANDRKITLTTIANYITGLFSSKTALDKITEGGGLPLYDGKPFGSIVKIVDNVEDSDSTTISLTSGSITKLAASLSVATDFTIDLTVAAGVIAVLEITAADDFDIVWSDAANIFWADGVALESMLTGEIARVNIAIDSATEIYMNWSKFSKV